MEILGRTGVRIYINTFPSTSESPWASGSSDLIPRVATLTRQTNNGGGRGSWPPGFLPWCQSQYSAHMDIKARFSHLRLCCTLLSWENPTTHGCLPHLNGIKHLSALRFGPVVSKLVVNQTLTFLTRCSGTKILKLDDQEKPNNQWASIWKLKGIL